jgi:hypothetical protein
MMDGGKRKVTPYKEFYGHGRPKKNRYETGIEGYEY